VFCFIYARKRFNHPTFGDLLVEHHHNEKQEKRKKEGLKEMEKMSIYLIILLVIVILLTILVVRMSEISTRIKTLEGCMADVVFRDEFHGHGH
jgi:hypothetical protein